MQFFGDFLWTRFARCFYERKKNATSPQHSSATGEMHAPSRKRRKRSDLQSVDVDTSSETGSETTVTTSPLEAKQQHAQQTNVTTTSANVVHVSSPVSYSIPQMHKSPHVQQQSPSPKNTSPTSTSSSPKTTQSPKTISPLQTSAKSVFVDEKGKCTLRVDKGSTIRKIAVLSDLHIGINGSKTCGFKQNDENVARYLTHMIDDMDYDLIVIDGDCFELWEPGPASKSPRKPMSRELFRDIVNSWPMTCDVLINSENVVLLNGNHDACIRTANYVEKCYADLILSDFSLYVAHGHQSDVWCADDSMLLGVAKLATRIYGHMELIRHSTDEDVEVLEKTIRSTGTKRCDFRAMTHAEMVATSLGCKIIAYGHTHNPLLLNTPDVLYCNTGNCCTQRDAFDQLDFELEVDTDRDALCETSENTDSTSVSSSIGTFTTVAEIAKTVTEGNEATQPKRVKATLRKVNVRTMEQTVVATAKRSV